MAQHGQLVRSRQVAGFSLPSGGTLKAYFLVTKPVMVSLLVFTGIVGFFLASQGDFPAGTFALALLALTLGCAGANTLTCYIDRDIDAVMERTRKRPIPSLQISPPKALLFGLTLVALSLGFSLSLNWLTFIIILTGIINNVVVYSIWVKRRTSLNILAGSLAGGLPVMAGYAAYSGSIDLSVLFLGAVVIVWTPVHIWSLALRYRKDYEKAGVPMLPVVTAKERVVRCIALASGLLAALSIIPAVLGLFGTVYPYSAAILGMVMVSLSLRLALRPVETRAWVVFKVSGIYLGLLFFSVLLDSLFHT